MLGIIVISCDDFLDVNPKDEVVNEEMLSTERGVKDAIYGAYAKMTDTYLYGEYLSISLPEILSQNFLPPVDGTALGNLARFQYDTSPVKQILQVSWKNAYELIGYTNNIIENLENREALESNYKIYLGETYAIRALIHFDLLRLFAPHIKNAADKKAIPYVTKYSHDITDFSTVLEVYNHIIIDLGKAQELLTDDKKNVQYPRAIADHIKNDFLKGRELHLNYYAVSALLARVYWMKGDLSKAKTEALKVINSNNFPLADKDEITTLVSGALSPKETIFGLYSKKAFVTNKKRFYDPSRVYGFGIPMGFFNNSFLKVYSLYVDENSGKDFRKDGWFKTTPYTASCYKVVDLVRITSESNTPASRGLLEGLSLIRIPEMYYIVAEAELAEGNVSEASKYVNSILKSRGLIALDQRVPEITLDIELLYNERHKEYYCEGVRWFDLKKRNMNINGPFEITPASDEVYVLPIPDGEVDYRN